MREGQREALGLIISLLGIAGLLAGLLGFPFLFESTWGYVLFGGAGICALVYVLLALRRGANLALGIVELGLFSTLAFGMAFGIMWYFMSYLPTHGGLGLELMFETPSNARNDFVSDLKSGNFDKAYNLLSPDAQKVIPDAATFRKLVTENNWQPTKWKWTTENADQEHADYVGEASYSGNKSGLIEIWLDKIDKHWKVSSMNFQPQ